MPEMVLPELRRFALAARRPAHGAGTCWYDVAALGEDEVAVVVARLPDGVPADLRERWRGILRGRLLHTRSPAAALGEADRVPGSPGEGATVLCAVLDAARGVVRWAALGPARLVVLGSHGAGRMLDDGAGGDVESPIAPGESVLLCTAAPVVRAGGPRGLDVEALADSVAAQAADAALVVVGVLPAPLNARLPAEAGSVPAVRRSVGGWAEQAGLSEDAASDLQLTLSEAVTNAVEHAYRLGPAGEFVYSVCREADGSVRAEVRDFGRWRTPPADPGYRGRGIALIHTLAVDVVLERADTGTRVAFTVPAEAVSLDATAGGTSAAAPVLEAGR